MTRTKEVRGESVDRDRRQVLLASSAVAAGMLPVVSRAEQRIVMNDASGLSPTPVYTHRVLKASDDELLSAINRLFKLAATNDAALCQSFSVSTEAATAAAVKRVAFWRTVGAAENLATQIAMWQ